MPLSGEHQVANLTLAVLAAEVLAKQGLDRLVKFGMNEFRCDLIHGHQHKTSFRNSRMGNFQPFML